jgi:hypothetical protein
MMSHRWDEGWSFEPFGEGVAIYNQNGHLMACGKTVEDAVDGMEELFDQQMASVMEDFILAGIPEEGIQA